MASNANVRGGRRKVRNRIEEGSDSSRRQQILDAARACFTERGLRQTTIRHIAEKAGMSVGHIYNSFSSKEEIVEAMTRAHAETFTKMLFEVLGADRDDRTKCEMHFRRMLDRILDSESAYLMVSFLNEALTNERICSLMSSLMIEFKDQIMEMRGPKCSHISSEVLEARIMFMMSLFQGLRCIAFFFPKHDKALLKQVAIERLMQWVDADNAERQRLTQSKS